MSEIALLVLILVPFLIPLLVLYRAIERETANTTVVKRSEAEQIARNRGGRPAGEKSNRVDESRDTDETGEWGTAGEWAESSEQTDRRQ